MKNTKALINFNNLQLNIVTFVDLKKALIKQTLDDCIYMMDNSPESTLKGTPKLQTICKQGQTLNWIIYPMEGGVRFNKMWPPYPRINNIVFLGENGNDVSKIKICNDLKIFGGPDKISDITKTPVYYYWAGTLPVDLPKGVYRYRLVIELEDEYKNKTYMNLNSPSIEVV